MSLVLELEHFGHPVNQSPDWEAAAREIEKLEEEVTTDPFFLEVFEDIGEGDENIHQRVISQLEADLAKFKIIAEAPQARQLVKIQVESHLIYLTGGMAYEGEHASETHLMALRLRQAGALKAAGFTHFKRP